MKHNELQVYAAVEKGNSEYWRDSRLQTEAAKEGKCIMRGSIIDYISRAVIESLSSDDDYVINLIVRSSGSHTASVRRSGDKLVVRVANGFCSGWLAHNHSPPDSPVDYSRRGVINQESGAVQFDTVTEAQQAAEYFVAGGTI